MEDYIKDYHYPDTTDPDLQKKIYSKVEFYYYKAEQRDKLENKTDVVNYRNKNCNLQNKDPKSHQLLITKFISPQTLYKNMLLMYGVGSGKTMAAILIAEQFKEQVLKYNSRIHIVVPGPNTRQNFIDQIIEVTKNTYVNEKNIDRFASLSDKDKYDTYKNIMKVYKIISYKSFYRKILGEKVIVRNLKGKKEYKKDSKGVVQRVKGNNDIVNLNNTLLIIDEAHNIIGNEYGDSLKKIVENSTNLRVVLLTATPMINIADEIVTLINYICPKKDRIQRDKVFTSDKNYNIEVKKDGLDYLKRKVSGYISFYRGSIPFTFAPRQDVGVLDKENMLFTPLIRCPMKQFQYDTYKNVIEDKHFNGLNKESLAVSNFVFPGLSKDKLIGYYSNEGMETVIQQLSNNQSKLCSMINKEIYDNKLSKDIEQNFIYTKKNKILGNILKKEYIINFSSKFHALLAYLEQTFNENASIGFIYSNIVKAGGIELCADTLIHNGYLEFQEKISNYKIKDDTIDYKTGLKYKDYDHDNGRPFFPAVFLVVTGKDNTDQILSDEIDKQKIIQQVYNSRDNTEGKHIKFILGSRVMGEGINLKNCKYVYIIDSFYNLSRIEQVIGRAIRFCSHLNSTNSEGMLPFVKIHRFVTSIGGSKDITTDEMLYKKAELKFLTIKKVERALKESAIDCPILLNDNMFPEEIEKYNKCHYPTRENVQKGKLICPAICDFEKCNYKCHSDKLNQLYWNDDKNTYNDIKLKNIDYNTKDINSIYSEKIIIKNKIKKLFSYKSIYSFDEIYREIITVLSEIQKKIFDKNLIYIVLEDLIPNDPENENFVDVIFDRFNRSGYLIKKGNNYFFQPLFENKNISMYYRNNIKLCNTNNISINQYIKSYYPDLYQDNIKEDYYNYNLEYYSKKQENFIVGIIDRNSSNKDIFKIRTFQKNTTKKRGKGIPTFKGNDCTTFGNKDELLSIHKKLMKLTDYDELKKIKDYNTSSQRENVCSNIKRILLHLEKYSMGKEKKMYIIIPTNHSIFPFPYNIEDRIEHLKDKIKLNLSLVKNPKINGIIMKELIEDKFYEINKSNIKNDNWLFKLSYNIPSKDRDDKVLIQKLIDNNFVEKEKYMYENYIY